MIAARSLTKHYGRNAAVQDLSFDVPSGVVTGFLGPNGSGKSTTMRMIMGLDRPTSGTALVGGQPYDKLRWPLREVGALLDAKAFHPGRTAYNHLRYLAATNGIPLKRVDEVLGIVGLTSVAAKRAGKYSLGMGQRLGIAGALLGDPGVVLFDEPVNGLDPEGIRWVRNLLRQLASEGRTVFVSSHLISEMSQTAHRLVVIGRGSRIAETTVEEFTANGTGRQTVRIITPATAALVGALRRAGATADLDGDGAILATGLSARSVGEMAAHHGITLYELSPVHATLEDAFMELTRDSVEFRTSGDTRPVAALAAGSRDMEDRS